MKNLRQIFSAINFTPFALGLIVVLLVIGEFRRNSAVAEIKDTYQMSRVMLNARAQIQLILINANIEGRKLNGEEIDRIGKLFKRAEYDLAEEK